MKVKCGCLLYAVRQEMVKNYESTNDKWRAFGYQKAIAALKRFPKEISSWEVCYVHVEHE